MNKTKIEYADYTWNPVTGCTKGCSYCYARKMTERNLWGYDFTPRFHPNRLDEPLKVKKPSVIFVCDMGDLFDPHLQPSIIMKVLRTALRASHHTYLFLTKRPHQYAAYLDLKHPLAGDLWYTAKRNHGPEWPPPNWWLGTTVTTQKEADERIPILLQVPAAKRWVSVEPMLGPVDLQNVDWDGVTGLCTLDRPGIDWVVCGGQSGPSAQPMHPAWPRRLRDQCIKADVPFFFKQWGHWRPPHHWDKYDTSKGRLTSPPAFLVDANSHVHWFEPGDNASDCEVMLGVGKKKAGRLLDGKVWDQMPKEAQHGDKS